MEMFLDSDEDSELITLAREYDARKVKAAKPKAQTQLKVVAYIRVSTENDSQLKSPEMQRDSIARYCKRRGYPPPKVFSDLGVSGRKESRTGWDEMMEYVRANPGCIIIVYDMTRFARKLETYVILYRQVVSAKARLESVNNHSANSLVLGMLAIMAELELRSIAVRLRDGRLRAAREGKKLGGRPPWGYVYTKDRKDIMINEKLREHIRHLFRMKAGGATFSLIANYLNDNGIATPSGKGEWNPTKLPRIMYSTIYMGIVKNKKTRFEWEDETVGEG